MYDLIFFSLLSGALAALLAFAYLLFTFALFVAYKVGGGRKGFVPYMKKYL